MQKKKIFAESRFLERSTSAGYLSSAKHTVLATIDIVIAHWKMIVVDILFKISLNLYHLLISSTGTSSKFSFSRVISGT
jgi:hypothetical protein